MFLHVFTAVMQCCECNDTEMTKLGSLYKTPKYVQPIPVVCPTRRDQGDRALTPDVTEDEDTPCTTADDSVNDATDAAAAVVAGGGVKRKMRRKLSFE